jgi:hypothetical protein
MDFGFGGGGIGDRQPVQNIIITILYHEHFSHGTSTFNGNNVYGGFDCITYTTFQVVFGKNMDDKTFSFLGPKGLWGLYCQHRTFFVLKQCLGNLLPP